MPLFLFQGFPYLQNTEGPVIGVLKVEQVPKQRSRILDSARKNYTSRAL